MNSLKKDSQQANYAEVCQTFYNVRQIQAKKSPRAVKKINKWLNKFFNDLSPLKILIIPGFLFHIQVSKYFLNKMFTLDPNNFSNKAEKVKSNRGLNIVYYYQLFPTRTGIRISDFCTNKSPAVTINQEFL